ncbi:7 transmembrane receptor [Oesophagostomum dentatum]|uniref:7 transmembrane receptor n=1 Tax=Oesophagostomum dentatum TaxID=61180 RepID=A0A0B1SZM3_OESDE|nr:7 transmembrane receptor [Oesophagostomum dentatum]
MFFTLVVQRGEWYIGNLMCDIYMASDVACSTASILLLAIISFDRYRAVSRPIQYSRQTQNVRRVFAMIGVTWLISLLVASPMVFGVNVRPPDANPHECRFYNAEFSIGSSIISFVIPCILVQRGEWYIGNLMCDIYMASDVACSTASILLLAIISFDRYRAVSRPIQYSRQTQNVRRVFAMIGVTWLISLLVASPMVFGLTGKASEAPERSHVCVAFSDERDDDGAAVDDAAYAAIRATPGGARGGR